MFNCKVCVERNLRVQDLQKEIEFLKKLVSPSTTVLPSFDLEMNRLLEGGGQEQPEEEITEEEVARLADIEREATSILTGTY